MTTPVMLMVPAAPAAAANSAPMGALLGAKAVVTTTLAKGTEAGTALAAKLHLGAALGWATRTMGWVIGKFAFLAKITEFFGAKTLLAWIMSSATGQKIVRTTVKVVAKIVTAPVRWVLKPLGWLAHKTGLDRLWAKPVAYLQAAGQGVGRSISRTFWSAVRPDRTWVRALHMVTGFKMNWAIAALGFIPTPITVIARALLIAGLAVNTFDLVAAKLNGRAAREGDVVAKAEAVVAEASNITRKAAEIKTDAAQLTKDTVEMAKVITEIAVESAPAPDTRIVQGAVEQKAQEILQATNLLADLQGALEEHEAEAVAAAEIVASQQAAVEPAVVADVPVSTRTPLEQAMDYRSEHGDYALACAVLTGEVPAHPSAMSRKRAKKVKWQHEVAARKATETADYEVLQGELEAEAAEIAQAIIDDERVSK